MKRIIDIIRHPRAAVVLHDFCMVFAAWFVAAWLIQSTTAMTLSSNISNLMSLCIVLVLQGSVLWATGLYKGLWRFASFPDMWNIARASIFGTVAIVAVLAVAEKNLLFLFQRKLPWPQPGPLVRAVAHGLLA